MEPGVIFFLAKNLCVCVRSSFFGSFDGTKNVKRIQLLQFGKPLLAVGVEAEIWRETGHFTNLAADKLERIIIVSCVFVEMYVIPR